MATIVVPEISGKCKNKTFCASDIKWVKTVNDKVTHTAYLPPDNPYNRVVDLNGVQLLTHDSVTNSTGVFFCLQLNPRFTDTLNRVPFGDLILLYQRLEPRSNNEYPKCFTHLVTPIGDTVVPNPYKPTDPKGGPGRWVKVIAMTGKQTGNSIPFGSTPWRGAGWRNAGFNTKYEDLSFMAGKIWDITHPVLNQLSNLQNDIWNRFQPWRV
ncbi:hypothetical protein FACS189479_03490 [Spirochaetia bacterium]|nr:hypothetical protein FACS189479_03490 [Spirochaetia bacterium]